MVGAGCASRGTAANGAPEKPAAAQPAKSAATTTTAKRQKTASTPKLASKSVPKSAKATSAARAARETAGEPSAVAAMVESLAPKVESGLREQFAKAGTTYPPKALALLAFKEERTLEVWAESGNAPVRVGTYPLLDSSPPGPKLEQGDWQIPEGVYRVTWLNPKSDYHLSLGLDYPNDFDRAKAAVDKRTDLGGDIFIHGKDTSIGCLAIGDPAVEELFVLVARVGAGNVRVLIAPDDLRSKPAPQPKVAVPWIDELYAVLRRELARYAAGAAPADAPARSKASAAAATSMPRKKLAER